MSDQQISDLQYKLRKAVSESHETIFNIVPERWRGDPLKWIKNELAKAA